MRLRHLARDGGFDEHGVCFLLKPSDIISLYDRPQLIVRIAARRAGSGVGRIIRRGESKISVLEIILPQTDGIEGVVGKRMRPVDAVHERQRLLCSYPVGVKPVVEIVSVTIDDPADRLVAALDVREGAV